MKSYKPGYALSSLFSFTFAIIWFGIALIPPILFSEDKELWLKVGVSLILIFLCADISICLLINLISKSFTKAYIKMDDKAIYDGNRCILINDIIRVKYDNGDTWTRNSKVNVLVIYGKENSCFYIERPSFMLMVRLKKICKDKFIIKHLYRTLFLYPIIAFILGFVLFYFFGR